MIDRDGIERPDNPHEHEFSMPQRKKKIKITEKTYIPKNPFYIFFCFLLRCIAVLVLPIFCKIAYRVKVYGKENLKKVKGKPVIFVSNHVHIMDFPSFSSCAIPFRKVNFLTLKSNLQIPVLGKIVHAFGGLPVPDSAEDYRCFYKSINKLLKNNKAIYIMAEGSLWKYHRDLRPFLPGAFKLAVKNNTPIVPVVFSFDMKVKEKKGKVKRKYKIRIRIMGPMGAKNNLEKREKVEEFSKRVHTKMSDFLTKFNDKVDKNIKK